MKVEDIKIGVSFIWTGSSDNIYVQSVIDSKVKFTVVDVNGLINNFSPFIYCTIECKDTFVFDFMKAHLEQTGPFKGSYRIGAWSADYCNWEIVGEKKEGKLINNYPHICPRCGAAAYVGLFAVDCSRGCK